MIHHRPQAFDHDFFRRSHVVSNGAVGSSMVLSLSLPLDEGNAGDPENSAPNAFIRIDSVGRVVLGMPRLESGQGESVRMLIAEELEVALNRVDLEHALPKRGFSGNAMSQVPPTSDWNAIRTLKLLRHVSAIARMTLITAAAKRWGIDASSCHAHEGEVRHAPTSRKLKYGELAIDAACMPIPREIALKAPRVESGLDRRGDPQSRIGLARHRQGQNDRLS
jgi:isoquinoline 1-oxidoreductase beta subunit